MGVASSAGWGFVPQAEVEKSRMKMRRVWMMNDSLFMAAQLYFSVRPKIKKTK